MNIERGFRGKIGDFADLSQTLTVRMTTAGNAVYDTCCFGVDSADKLSDDRYTVFYNQPSSPAGEITYRQNGICSEYQLLLNNIPPSVAKLVFTVSIDGNGTMGQISSHTVELVQNGITVLSLVLSGNNFKNEKAIIDLEVYKKTEWRVSAVARGFDGGLDDLLRSYGGVISEAAPADMTAAAVNNMAYEATPVSNESQFADKLMNKISLSKDKINLEKHVISLSKCVVDLTKRSGVDLGNIRARVAVAIDYSGSMSSLYRNGTVQRTLNRLVPLGLTFDDNGSIDMYLFQSDFRKIPDLDLSNYEYYVDQIIKTSGYSMGGTSYSPVLKAIITGNNFRQSDWEYSGRGDMYSEPLVNDYCPTFVLFITDGENGDKPESDDIIRLSSQMNVFIQFIGIGKERFNYLMKLDDLPGRMRDNTGFTKMADLDSVSDDMLYFNVLEQFSNWLKGLQ